MDDWLLVLMVAQQIYKPLLQKYALGLKIRQPLIRKRSLLK